jgi:hypothetical protein
MLIGLMKQQDQDVAALGFETLSVDKENIELNRKDSSIK